MKMGADIEIPDKAREILLDFCPIPEGTVLTENSMLGEIDLSIIVPAYNVEEYIEPCMESILQQKTKYAFEVIAVDDGSTDRTAEKLESFSNNKAVKVIHQKNRGASGARNCALKRCRGRYIMFVDSDDYILPGAIESLMDAAYAGNADIVEGNAFSFFNNGKIGERLTHTVREGYVDPMSEFMGYPWAKVYKSQIFASIRFPENCLFEDTILIMLVYPQQLKCQVINADVYAYRINPKGTTQSSKKDKRGIESHWITEYLMTVQQAKKLISERTFVQFFEQVAINYSRVRRLERIIQTALLSESRRLYKQYYGKRYDDVKLKYKHRKIKAYFDGKSSLRETKFLLRCWYVL